MAKPTCQAGCCAAGDGGPGIPPQLRPNIEPVDTLTAYRRNPRRGDTALIAGSLTANGQYRPVVANTGTLTGRAREVLAGNHTVAAARELGWQHVAATWVDVDDDRAARIVAVDNRSNDVAGYDDEALLALLADLPDLDGTGYDEDFLRDLEATLEPFAGGDDEPGDVDDVPEPPGEPVTKPGDVWVLGDHRVICGDCRDPAVVAAVLDGARINLAFTSPPYASQREYDESSGFKPIPPDAYVDRFEPVQANVRAHLATDGSWFVNIKENSEDGQRVLYVKDLVISHVRVWGWRWVEEFCWLRSALPGDPAAMRRFKNGFEPVFQFATSADWKFRPTQAMHESDATFKYKDQAAAGKVIKATAQGVGGGTMSPVAQSSGLAFPSNVLEIRGGANVVGHSAAFPVKFPQWFIRAYSDPGDVVFDPFMGSGTTLVAADVEDRVAYGCELSPTYCDLIARRWQEHTGRTPILRRDGHPDTGYDMATGQPAETTPAGA